MVESGPKFKRKLSASASREESLACVSVSSQEGSGALNLEHLLEHLRRQVQVQRLHKQESVNIRSLVLELQYGIRAVRIDALFGDCGPVVHLVQGIFFHCTMIHINNQPNIMILNTCYPRIE